MSISNKRERLGWYFYDWANSAFPTTVITVFLGPYITSIANNVAVNGQINVYGISIASGSYYPYLVSISVFLQVFFLPIIGSIADKTRAKKLILGITAYIGALATLSLFFLDGNQYIFGGWMFVIANIAFGASIVVYNSILNDISTIDERDEVSSKGWAFGYIGGGLLLLINLVFFSNAENFGISTSDAVRICLASAGAWWAVFTLFPLLWIRNYKNQLSSKDKRPIKIIKGGFEQFINTFKNAKKYPRTLYFLIAYLMYNDGVQAVIALAAQFGQEELGLEMSFLTFVILIVQFVAFGGALFFGKLANYLGTKKALAISIIIWICAIIFAFGFLYGKTEFLILGLTIGLVMGGTQALSRSLFSKIIPKNQEAEYFSFYEISERGTSWLAPLLFGLVYQFTASYRLAILSLLVFFVIGLYMLLRVKLEKAIIDAQS
ncbi:MAG TPA: MFS transporter [Candidatus Kapabacteria bacterium]|nr:MFS transporter [Candidatus Kapabacteria bacterium]HPP38872.1 MFS transporter [Candidatus Kapabacteria bacterium]